MVFAGTNFGLYFRGIRGDWRAVFKDPEWRFYIGIISTAVLLITWDVWVSMYDTVGEAFRYSAFQVVSIITTTGYATADFNIWPSFSKLVLVALMFVGGCAGSTGGGMKIIRILVLLKYSYIGTEQAIRPHMVLSLIHI